MAQSIRGQAPNCDIIRGGAGVCLTPVISSSGDKRAADYEIILRRRKGLHL